MSERVWAAAEQFRSGGEIVDVQPYGQGNLNDTFLVTLQGGPGSHLILQRINTHVFRHPQWIMDNLRAFSDHVRDRLAREPEPPGRRWVVPYVLPTVDGADSYVDPQGGFWRALSFVDHATCYQTVQDNMHAREAGYALGRFHTLISDLDPGRLHDTLEGFHVTPRYLIHYDRVLAAHEAGKDERFRSSLDKAKRSSKAGDAVAQAMAFVAARRAGAGVLEDALQRGELITRNIHGDPKINNIMVDEQTGRAVSLVDLDTIKPGLVHYDIGDCLRSCCNPLGEETERFAEVYFDLDYCAAILEGYLDQARTFLSPADRHYIYDAIRLIAFELGLRFFTDYLEGDVYFKARHPEHNLNRARVQFQLAAAIEAQEAAIRALVDRLWEGA